MKRLSLVLLVLVLSASAVLLAANIYLNAWSARPLTVQQEDVLAVPSGSTLYQLSADLERSGVLDSALLFRLYARLHPGKGQIKAGDYALALDMTPAELYANLQSGAVLQYNVTLVDGQSFASFLETLRRTDKLVFTLDEVNIADQLAEWGSDIRHPEGLFFPDTYTFQRGDTDVSILKRAYQRMQQQLQSEWEARAEDLPYKTPYEALIMASIVEKETGVPSERGEIAGVFVNRLRLGMRLQTDPTVIYGLGERYQGNLKKRHLNEYTPYNTYRIDGLPPTPIANPGLAAINAALHPAPTKALYFVARGDGSHQFSVTLADHEAAVRQYQLKRRKDYRSSPQ